MKKTLKFVIVFMVFLATLSMNMFITNNVNAAESISKISQGTGTTNDPYIIYDKEQLKEIYVNLSAYYKLGADIDLGNEEWVTNTTIPFTGTFDGNGYVIGNLKITKPTVTYVGFFGQTSGATLKNITLRNASVEGSNYVGGLIGLGTATTIDNCVVEGTGEIKGQDYVGGIAGQESGTIIKSVSKMKVTGRDYIGGIAGYLYSGTISESYYIGEVTGRYYAGGIAGAGNYGNIKNCYSFGLVTGSANYAGGILGYAASGCNIQNSYSGSKVTGVSYVGGVCGTGTTITNSYYDGYINQQNSTTGTYVDLGRLPSGMKSANTYTGWDFTGVWAIDEGSSYPYLRKVSKPAEVVIGATTDVASGRGTLADPYIIMTKEQLKNIRYDFRGSYKLGADIDLGNEEWVTNTTVPFTGTFDGNGYVISNLKITRPTVTYVGFFGQTSGATLKNITLKNVSVQGSNYVGGLIGLGTATTIDNCVVEGTGEIKGQDYVGGIAGQESGTISKSISKIKVTGRDFTGGISGYIYSGTISESYYIGEAAGRYYAGGIAGQGYYSTIKNCYSFGLVNGSASYVGGILGYAASGCNIQNSYSGSKVTGVSYVGGVCGTGTTISNSYYDSDVNQHLSANGTRVDLGRHSYEMKSASTFNSWDFTGIWAIDEGEWYPYFKNLSRPAGPDIVENITATATSNSITISWKPVIGAVSYEVEVSGMSVDVGSNTSYTHTGLNPNTQRVYRVRAKNYGGIGKWSDVIVKSTLPDSAISIYTTATSSNITISWNKISGAVSYDLEADGQIIGDLTDTQYIHENLSPSALHTYRVRSKNNDGNSVWSEAVQAYTLPETPSGLIADVKGESITLSWSSSIGAETYELEIDGAIKDIGNNTSYLLEWLGSNTEHTFKVRARYNNVRSLWSNTVSTYTHSGVPVNVKAENISKVIKLTWDMVEGANSYDIEVNGSVAQSVYSNIYEYKDINANTIYVFRVRSVNSAGASEWSAEASVATLLGIPENVNATASNDSITVGWQVVVGANSYEVLVDGEIMTVSGSTYFVHSGLQPNSIHVYRVRAKNGDSVGEWSEPLMKTTIQGIPSNIRTKIINKGIFVMWDAVAGATGYEIKADGSVIDVKGDCSYYHDNLISNSVHTYAFRSVKDGVVSPWSTEISVKMSPDIPQNLIAAATTNEIKLNWDTVSGAVYYDVEIDGVEVVTVDSAEYIHSGLESNTMHSYRVRAKNESSASEWSLALNKITNPVLEVNAGKDTTFNFVFIIPAKYDATTRTIKVKYNPEELDVEDLCAVTPIAETKPGKVEGTNITIKSYTPGEIVYVISDTTKTQVNSIKFLSKVNEHAKVVYTVE